MQNTILRILIFCTLAIATVNCERATTDSSHVSLQLPVYSNMTSLTCTKCLKAIIVNVDGDNFKTIRFNQKLDRIDEAASEIQSSVNVEVPSGPNRKIQVMAIYRLSNGTMEIQYGSVVSDLFGAEPPPITLSLANLGPFKGGSIAGRYLNGAVATGPTGKVIISITHAASGMSMDLLKGEMLNGWFDFFGSENFPMSYRFEDGVPLIGFQNVTLNTFMPLTGAAAVNHIARVHRPFSYFSYDGTNWNPVNEYHDIVFGYFGLGATLKHVCFEKNPSAPAGMTFTKLSSSNLGTPPLTYHHNNNTADVYGISGQNHSDDVLCTGSRVADRFESNKISINRDQFNGNGNDTAKAIGGAFTYIADGSFNVSKYTKVISVNTTYTFKGLPELFATSGTLFDGTKLFEKDNAANGGFEDVKCNPLWLGANGFAEVTTFSTAPTVSVADTVTFAFSGPPPTTNGYILCPTTNGIMIGLGGFYVGSL